MGELDYVRLVGALDLRLGLDRSGVDVDEECRRRV